MDYSAQTQKDIKRLFIEGVTYQDISYTVRIPYTNVYYQATPDKFTDQELNLAVKELEATHKEYDGILNYNSPLERFLNKKGDRLIRLLKARDRWPIGNFKDIAKEAKKIFPFFRNSRHKHEKGTKVSYFTEREN